MAVPLTKAVTKATAFVMKFALRGGKIAVLLKFLILQNKLTWYIYPRIDKRLF